VMGVIDHAPMTVARIARVMGLRRQSVQRTADVLAADGVAEYLDNPPDRRARLLTLTPRGRRALRAIERAQFEWARNHGEAIGRKRLESAASALEETIAQLERSD
jgi:DNA-binding MarR family transcriptional regulator